MAIRSSFFNSEDGDRKYNAADFAEYFNSLVNTGIFPKKDNSEFKVESNNNMTVTVKAGQVWIEGYSMINDNDYVLDIDTASGSLNRIDRVVIRLDLENRKIELDVKKGEITESPVAPELQRDNVIYELGIADINVGSSISEITQEDIVDTRADSELAGKVNSVIAGDIKAHEQVRATPHSLGHVKAETLSDGTLVIPDSAPEIKVDGQTIFINEMGELTLFDPNEEIVPDSWTNVQRIIRNGDAADIFAIGEEVTLNYEGKPTKWIVVGIDHDTPVDSKLTHSVTLHSTIGLFKIPIDSKEPANPNSTRADFGNNNYPLSNIHQWLNNKSAIHSWSATHDYDAAPESRYTEYSKGFLSGFDDDVKAIINPVKKTVTTPSADGDGHIEFEAAAFLLSEMEITGRGRGDATGQSRYANFTGGSRPPYYKDEDGKDLMSWVFRDANGERGLSGSSSVTGSSIIQSPFLATGIIPAITIC